MAETYTGRAEKVTTNERGVTFEVVIENSQGKEIFRRSQWISTGVMTGVDAKEGIKRVVTRMTQALWAHLEGAKEAVTYKGEVEGFRSSCDSFIPTKERPNAQPGMGQQI